MSNDIRTAIPEALAHAGVTFTATYRGERKNALGGGNTMDEWSCVFRREEGDRYVEFAYFTGLGLRKKGRYLSSLEWRTPDKPQAPSPADVLQCLIFDAEACDQSFESWCSEFDYDTDSRKALDTYEECQINGDKLRSIFTREQLDQFAELLRDY